jgi:DNA-binding NtrC family response regulator
VVERPARATILIAESDPQLRRLFHLLLSQHYVVAEAPSARSAVDMLRESPEPLVVVWDLWLSQTAGQHLLEVLEREPALQRHAFLLLTSELQALSPAQRQRARRQRIPVLALPFDVDEFQHLVAEAFQDIDGRIQATD